MAFDLIVLGGGPGGYLAAERAAQGGLQVALVEERALGGVCLNEGCIPTKTLLYSAKLYDGVRFGEKYGVRAEGLHIDHQAVLKRKNKVVRSLVGGVKAMLKQRGVNVFAARGILLGKADQGFQVQAGEEVLTGERLVIATGSSSAVPPIPGVREGLDSGFVLTNREILELDTVPDRLCVIGGGIIGLEFASYFCPLGSQVTVVEMLDHIAGETDQELVDILKKDLEKRGIVFELSARVTALEGSQVRYEKDGEQRQAAADKVLLSVGRRPNTSGLGLETLGVLMEKGAVVTDDRMATNVPGVYAVGDVNGISMLAHTAYREAEVAVNNMLGKKDRMRYEAVPAVLYTNPELSGVGETEATAQKKGLAYQVVKLPMRFSGRYQAENEGGNGLLKLLVHPGTQKVLGVQALSNYSSEFIVAAASFIQQGLTLDEIKRIVFPHPTVSEIIREAVFQYQ